MAVLYTLHYAQFFDNDGEPLAGGKLYTYAAGTTTPKATYTTADGNIENDNPIILDSAGRAKIFLAGSYKFVLHDSNDAPVDDGTTDNVTAFTATAEEADAFYQSFSGTGSQTAFTLSEDLGDDEKTIMVFIDSGLQNIVTNGTFATDSSWTKGSGWSIGAGVATAVTASSDLTQTSAVTVDQGQSYNITYTITRSAGTITPSIGGASGTARSSSGTYSETIIAGSTQALTFTGSGFSGTVDNVTITPSVGAGFDIQPPTAYTLNGTSLSFTTAPASGTNNIQVWAPARLANEAAASAAAADASATAAAASASAAATSETDAEAAQVAAATSEANAALSAAKLSGTSTSSVAIGTGSKGFTTQADKFFGEGSWLLITSDANEANYMHGQVTAYSGTSLTVNVTNIGGSGTLADWTIRVSGTRGATGATGGPVADGDYGDITISGTGTVYTIDDGLAATKIANGTVDNTEFQYLNGVTSGIQSQLDAKVALTGTQTVGGVKTFSSNPIVSGGGVQFPATQVPSADSNCLDDYEEGSFTPTWTAASVNPVIGNGTITGNYVKVGRFVRIQIRIVMGSTTTFGTGNYTFGNFPFAAATTYQLEGMSISGVDAGTSYRQGFTFAGGIGADSIGVFNSGTFAIWSPTVPHTWANTDEIYININYETTA